MKVIQTIQSTDPFKTGVIEAPVEHAYYTGDSLALAISAMVEAAAQSEREDRFFRVLSVRLVLADVEV